MWFYYTPILQCDRIFYIVCVTKDIKFCINLINIYNNRAWFINIAITDNYSINTFYNSDYIFLY